ncbi:hypothetical protein MMUR_26320 [Mycolicibacterium murale]|uniref:Uncharacterized protein n=1 Tax=Mycolicibacterium murale TaxID=182220 RepID=A0A7I9WMH6_9MYCO|nr:hypothetical protein MMUR_26320 [Mycolicibacterium murale]
MRPKLMALGPGRPVGVAQDATTGAKATPALSSRLERSIDLRVKRRSSSDSVIVDLRVVAGGAVTGKRMGM